GVRDSSRQTKQKRGNDTQAINYAPLQCSSQHVWSIRTSHRSTFPRFLSSSRPCNRDTSSAVAAHPQRWQLFSSSLAGAIKAPHHRHPGPHTSHALRLRRLSRSITLALRPLIPLPALPLASNLVRRQPYQTEQHVTGDRTEHQVAQSHRFAPSVIPARLL